MNTKDVIKTRGLLIVEGRVLLCKNINQDFFFLPGGSLKKNESLISCMVREFKEELGLYVYVKTCLGSIKCYWQDQNTQTIYHEFNMLFEVKCGKSGTELGKMTSLEKHIEFHMVEIDKIKSSNLKILPSCVINILLNPLYPPMCQFEDQTVLAY